MASGLSIFTSAAILVLPRTKSWLAGWVILMEKPFRFGISCANPDEACVARTAAAIAAASAAATHARLRLAGITSRSHRARSPPSAHHPPVARTVGSNRGPRQRTRVRERLDSWRRDPSQWCDDPRGPRQRTRARDGP